MFLHQQRVQIATVLLLPKESPARIRSTMFTFRLSFPGLSGRLVKSISTESAYPGIPFVSRGVHSVFATWIFGEPSCGVKKQLMYQSSLSRLRHRAYSLEVLTSSMGMETFRSDFPLVLIGIEIVFFTAKWSV